MDSSEKIKAAFRLSARRVKLNFEQAQSMDLPDPVKISQGFDDWEKAVGCWIDDPKLPQKQRVEKLILWGRTALQKGDEPELKSLIYDIGRYSESYHTAIGLLRDEKRQAGTQKERRPKVSAWINKQLMRKPDSKSPELWNLAPEWITDDIGYDRFSKRVTEERKKILSGRK